MNILMSGSRRGGHIYPCISLYKYLIDYCNVFIVIFKKIDKKLFDLEKINYYFIDDELPTFTKLKLLRKFIRYQNIEKTITFGGKNSLYINLVAKYMNLNCYIFEQNVILGKANLMNYLICKKIFTNFQIGLKKEINVGNPNSYNLKCNKINLFNNNKITILITMGSLGSDSVNKIIKQFIKSNNSYNIIYVLGNNIKSEIQNSNSVKIFNYYTPLTDLINYCDIVISRAGASTLSEIIALHKPSIIIPSPYVANNHQYKNAKYLFDKKACLFIEEKNTNVSNLNELILKLSVNKNLYKNIKENLIKLSKKDNFKLIKDVILDDNI